MKRWLIGLMVVVASSALAEVGKISTLEGTASRKSKDGATEELKVGSQVELGDTLIVSKGFMRFELTDGSIVALSEGSNLAITEADFEGQERKGFKAFLNAGSLWTKVKKALGGGKFEVNTERAVAGVRGTIFRIDADTLVKAAKGGSKGGKKKASIVRVLEGVVNVKPSESVAKASKPGSTAAPKGPRHQVAGPQEISADEWEKKFVDLQANQQIVVGVDLWDQAEIEATARNDAFSKWLEKNQ